MIKKRQKITVCLTSKSRDFFGVWSVDVLINSKEYTYSIPSEFAVEEFERLCKKTPGKALNWLKKFNLKEKEESSGARGGRI